jgi:hypothetical protein
MAKFLANENVPGEVTQFMLAVLGQTVTWEGNFSVAQEVKLRVVPLPD